MICEVRVDGGGPLFFEVLPRSVERIEVGIPTLRIELPSRLTIEGVELELASADNAARWLALNETTFDQWVVEATEHIHQWLQEEPKERILPGGFYRIIDNPN